MFRQQFPHIFCVIMTPNHAVAQFYASHKTLVLCCIHSICISSRSNMKMFYCIHLNYLPSFKLLTKDGTYQSHANGDANPRKHIRTKSKRLLILRRRLKWQRWWFWLLMKLDFIGSSFFLFCNKCRTNYLLLPRISNYRPPFAGKCCNV